MKKIVIWSLVVIVVLLLVAGVWWVKNKKSAGPSAPMGALEALAQDGIILEVLKGQVKVSFEGEEKTLTAPVGQEVEPGVIITTLAGSQANLVFPNGSVARLDEETSVNLNEFLDEAQSSSVKLQLNSGNLWSRVQRLLDKETSYEVQTANTVAVVKGTVFNLAYKEGKTKLEVLDKKVVIKAIDPKTKQALAGGEAEVESGKAVELDEKSPPTAQRPIVVKVLTAQELDRPWLKDNLAKDKQIEEKIKQASGGSGEVKQQELKTKVLPLVTALGKKDFSDKPLFEKFQELKEARQLLREKELNTLNQVNASGSPKASVAPTINKATPLTNAAPTAKLGIASISPNTTYGPGYQYTKATIKGSGFGALIKGTIGGLALTDIKVLDANTLEAMISPKLQPGAYDVALVNGLQKAVLSKGFTVLEAE